MNGWVDLHVHSTDSDGLYSRKEVIKKAYDAGIRYLAISDHDYVEDLDYLRDLYSDMTLITSGEFNALYYDKNNKKHIIHILGLGADAHHPKIIELIKRHNISRKPYIDQILHKLSLCNIYVGTYEELLEKNKGRDNFGRSLIAKEMVEKGYVKDVDEAFDIYLGAFKQRLAYVENPLEYAPLKEVIDIIIESGGIPVLCHLNYYCMDEENNHELLRLFSSYTKGHGALEVYYGIYTKEQREEMKHLADQYHLKYSCGSDYHGHRTSDTLEYCFNYDDVHELMEELNI